MTGEALDQELGALRVAGARGRIAVNRALCAQISDVIDPPTSSADHIRSRDWIRTFIREGLGWTKDGNDYVKDRDFAWCGAFAAWCWMHAGLRADVRFTFLASTYRLDHLARGVPLELGGRSVTPPAGQRVRVTNFSAAFDVEPGDILVVGHDKPYGDHITVVEGFVSGVFRTLEGNATGPRPDGTWKKWPSGQPAQGVVRRTRTVKEAKWLLRFGEQDFRA